VSTNSCGWSGAHTLGVLSCTTEQVPGRITATGGGVDTTLTSTRTVSAEWARWWLRGSGLCRTSCGRCVAHQGWASVWKVVMVTMIVEQAR